MVVESERSKEGAMRGREGGKKRECAAWMKMRKGRLRGRKGDEA